eukprot:g4499.t1
MISALEFVPKGAAKEEPVRYAATEEEEARMMAEAGGDDMMGEEVEEDEEVEEEEEEEEEVEEGMGGAEESKGGDRATGLPADLNMDDYDDEEDDGPELMIGGLAVAGGEDGGVPTIEIPDEEALSDAEEDQVLRESDAIILVAQTEEDYSCLEVHVYEEDTGNLYVHHDIALPAFPLCLAWTGFGPGQEGPGNHVAVGTFKPGIEIWNLDVLDALEPDMVLGGPAVDDFDDFAAGAAASGGGGSSKKKNKKNKKNKNRGGGGAAGGGRRGRPALVPGSHTDAVMGLSWNRLEPKLLASGSADATVKLWNMEGRGELAATFDHHQSKVQCVEWHPTRAQVLATGSFDKTVAVFDVAAPDNIHRISTGSSDIECLRWNPHRPQELAFSTEDGTVTCYDVRNTAEPLFTLKAHDKAASALAFSPLVEDLMVTASTDKTVKLWDIGGNAPAAAGSKTMAIGDIFAASFYPSSGFLLAAGGSKGALAIWDTTENPAFVRRFEKRMKGEGAVLPPNLASAAATAATTTTTTVAAAAAAAPAVASDGAAAMGQEKKGEPSPRSQYVSNESFIDDADPGSPQDPPPGVSPAANSQESKSWHAGSLPAQAESGGSKPGLKRLASSRKSITASKYMTGIDSKGTFIRRVTSTGHMKAKHDAKIKNLMEKYDKNKSGDFEAEEVKAMMQDMLFEQYQREQKEAAAKRIAEDLNSKTQAFPDVGALLRRRPFKGKGARGWTPGRYQSVNGGPDATGKIVGVKNSWFKRFLEEDEVSALISCLQEKAGFPAASQADRGTQDEARDEARFLEGSMIHYQTSGFLDLHCDIGGSVAPPPGSPDRRWTVIVMLKSPARGGQTHFPNAAGSPMFVLTAGDVLLWPNYHVNLDSTWLVSDHYLHEALRVTSGEKIIVNMWIGGVTRAAKDH